MNQLQIRGVHAREILDSRGNPTVEAEITLADGTVGRASVPSGASTGEYEAVELRDGEITRYGGKGVRNAVKNVNTIIANGITGLDASDIYGIDKAMLYLDGTEDKSKVGANAILAVSMACCKAASRSLGIPLHRFLGGIGANTMPLPMMNILNGGAHASNGIDVQEFMILPVGALNFKEGLRWGAEVFHTLADLLREEGYSTAVGDEGGFAPEMKDEKAALDMIVKAIKHAGYEPGTDIVIGLDAAASEWKGSKAGEYVLPKSGKKYTTEELITHWEELVGEYPIVSLEDPLDEEDWEGWKRITEILGSKIQIVGDDLFVTNTRRLSRGIQMKCGNSILIKLNQIGTVSETLEAIKLAHRWGYTAIASHRSGETEDTFIADLAVGLNMGLIKTGAPSRTERVAKYNRLLRIEERFKKNSTYRGELLLRPEE